LKPAKGVMANGRWLAMADRHSVSGKEHFDLYKEDYGK
jgi:hypothetical protein